MKNFLSALYYILCPYFKWKPLIIKMHLTWRIWLIKISLTCAILSMSLLLYKCPKKPQENNPLKQAIRNLTILLKLPSLHLDLLTRMEF